MVLHYVSNLGKFKVFDDSMEVTAEQIVNLKD